MFAQRQSWPISQPWTTTASFSRASRKHGLGPPEPGDYVVELIANRGIELTSLQQRRGFLWFTVRFLEGPRRGRELRLSIVVDGPPSMALLVRRGLQVLEDWRSGTRTPAATELRLAAEDIARNGRRLKVVATLGRAVTADGTAIPTLLKIRIDGARR